MEFKQLQSFAAVVRCGSFTKAAEDLYLSQPTISAHIRMLEEELGVNLLKRTTKSVEVSPKGQELYEYAVSILSLRDRMVLCSQKKDSQLIHLGTSTIPSAYALPLILPKYEKENPHVGFSIHQSDSQGVVNGLLDGIFDVGLIGMECKEDSVICKPFAKDRMVLITPNNNHFQGLKKKKTLPVKKLMQEPMILREKGSGSEKSADFFLSEMGVKEEDLHVVARTNDQESIKNLVASGFGIAIMSKRAAHSASDQKKILIFDLPKEVSTRNLYVIYRKNSPLQDYISRFITFVLSFSKEPLS